MSVCKMCSVSIAGHRSSLDKTLDVLIKTGVFHPDELKKFYSERITSRLFGNFSPLRFSGQDKRMIIKKLGVNK